MLIISLLRCNIWIQIWHDLILHRLIWWHRCRLHRWHRCRLHSRHRHSQSLRPHLLGVFRSFLHRHSHRHSFLSHTHTHIHIHAHCMHCQSIVLLILRLIYLDIHSLIKEAFKCLSKYCFHLSLRCASQKIIFNVGLLQQSKNMGSLRSTWTLVFHPFLVMRVTPILLTVRWCIAGVV